MSKSKQWTAYVLGAIFLAGGIGHLASPEISSGFIPDFLPKTPVHIGTAIVELALGLGVFFPAYRVRALQGILLLLVLFLPLHVIDLFRENPVIGSRTAAIIRVPMQFLLGYMAWYAARQNP